MRTATVTTADIVPALSAYATRFHAGVDKEHHVASPLGAWMLLALCAPGSEGRLRNEITEILGVDVDTAAAFAGSLLDAPHPAVAFAAGVWTSRSIPAPSSANWLARLPSAIDRGPLPSQSALHAWAKARTNGLIRRFSAEITPDTMLIVATALATNVTWEKAFLSEAAVRHGLAGSAMWSGNVERVLKTPSAHSHDQFIAATERAGDVGVHTVHAREGMSVTSVIAARDVLPSDVMATAYEIGCGRYVAKRSLFDLPLGESQMWSISEQSIETAAPSGREERCEAVLPAWRAEARHDLRRADLGFPAVAAALRPIVGMVDYPYEATQAVVAHYTRTGFTAAALSELWGTLSRMANPPRRTGVLRVATLRFGHPFAVVAATSDRQRLESTTQFGPWHRLPVYSAWVAEPTEAAS